MFSGTKKKVYQVTCEKENQFLDNLKDYNIIYKKNKNNDVYEYIYMYYNIIHTVSL